ncbi:TPA: hypothetical protein N0F65_002433 [Lagenidium giganteum]|uniref:Protein PTHB1 n=1 Tax=Lagenidium giganteum TaxID=4803 RepID=A0AAV2YMF6_9STRA|nr:TPA: hypothetical protein N0F65_002433 [Lagenidium giganteum]
MSLFQAREWWAVKSDHVEEYSYGGLLVGNVDNDTSGQVKILTGSLNGMLRMYFPTQQEFKIDHLLLEENLGHPILQIELGAFVPNQRVMAVAVLHPRRLCVYVIEGVGGHGMSASYFKLSLRYEHLLGIDGEHFTAYNMIYGPFGTNTPPTGRSERDHLCVQSLDGRLQFFEQDRFAFMQPLNGSFIPGAICCAPGMDAVIAATSDLQIECYRYQVLASASLKKKKANGLDEETKGNAQPVRQIHSDWKLNLGETVLDIRVGRCCAQENATSFDIIVLCEHTLFCIKPHGEIILQKRLGYIPSTLCLYRRAPAGSQDTTAASDNMIVSSHSKIWMVYKEKTLIWSACSTTVPVAMHVSDFGGIDGMIVTLDGDGAVHVNYLGTDPPSSSVVSTDTKDVNYEEMDEEHRQLLNVIRRAQGERRTEPKDRLLLRAQVPTVLDAVNEREDGSRRQNGAQTYRGIQLTVRVYLTYTGNSRVSNITLSIMAPENIVPSESSIVIDSIDGKSSTPLIVPIVLRPSSTAMPTSLELTIAAAYVLETGQPRVSQIQVRLPMCLACRLVPPVKASTFKFTLETNREPLEMTSLFEDMFHQPFCTPEWAKQVVGGSGTNVLSFQYYNGVDATILVSKNAGRYRIQSGELEALWMVSNELVERLKNYFAGKDAHGADSKGGDSGDVQTLEVFYQEPLPLADFFGTIDNHFNLRKEKLELSAELNDRAHQFRVIQKRLLVRYKDRNPSAINCLDVLLHGTYDQLITLSHKMEEVEAKLRLASNRLSCCVQLILMLIRFRFNLDDESAHLLQAYLSPTMNENGAGNDQGWEERTDGAMTELLRTVLAKQPNQQKDNNHQGQQTTELIMPDDTKKLKKHITIVCDRLGKGASLIAPPVPCTPSEHK